MPIFDTHAHYDDEAFDADRDEVLASLAAKGVGLILNCASDMDSCRTTVELSKKYPFVYGAVGIHPHSAAEWNDSTAEYIAGLAADKKIKAIGEIGLDYHYDFAPRELQQYVFEQQIILANELSLPVVVHDREAHADTLALLNKHRPRGVLHCYSGSVELAAEAAKIGFYFGFGGAVTFTNAKSPRAAFAAVPAERLLLETDCPYMAPVPFRGKRCTSDMISVTAASASELHGMTPEKLIELCEQNGKRLFSI